MNTYLLISIIFLIYWFFFGVSCFIGRKVYSEDQLSDDKKTAIMIISFVWFITAPIMFGYWMCARIYYLVKKQPNA